MSRTNVGLPSGLVLIIGAMKSGTTTLFEYLSRHSEVAHSRIKEPNFFTTEWEQKDADWYRGLFAELSGEIRWALEASTSYTKSPFVASPASRIASFPAEKRLIYIMRDPVERARSHIAYGQAMGWSSFMVSDGQVPWKALQVSRYAQQLEPYWEKFAGDILLLFFEDLVEDPRAVVRKVVRFLELADEFPLNGLGRAHNATENKLVRPAWYNRIQDNPVWVQISKRIPAKRWLARRVLRLPLARRIQFDEDQRARIVEALRDDLISLRRDYGVNISRWGYDF